MKNLKIFKIEYKNNVVFYKIVATGTTPILPPNSICIQFRTIPKFIADGYLNKPLSVIWKLSYPNQLLNSCKYQLKGIKHNITELYKRLTTKDYIIPEYKYMSADTGELFKDWKEVSEDIWKNIKHGCLPSIYVYNPSNFN